MDMLDDEALLERAREERLSIFERYDRGRSDLSTIDRWEDPAFEVYHQMDSFGFLHDDRLPAHKALRRPPDVNFELLREREKKWLQMLNRWDGAPIADKSKKTKKNGTRDPKKQPVDQHSKQNASDVEKRDPRELLEKLTKRTYKGIPNQLRIVVWQKILRVNESIAQHPGVYQKMLGYARKWSTEVRQIDSDVNRQFRDHVCYRERYSVKQKCLFNVLTAYSMYNMECGYCQGMAGVAGILLMYMDEEQAFWALSTFMSDPKYAMHGLFVEGFPKLTRFLAHHDRVLAKFLPKLHRHFAKHGLDAILYSLKWFFVIFVERVPFSLCLRIWDIYMLEGERVVTAMAFTILRMHRSKLLNMKDMDAMTDLLQTQLHRDFGYSDDHVVRTLKETMDELRRYKLDLPPAAGPNEQPRRRLGEFVEPEFEAKMGLRKSIFTDKERLATETILKLNQEQPDLISNFSNDNSDELTACLLLDDTCSMYSSSIARTSIASTTTTQNNNNNHDATSSWSDDNHSGTDVDGLELNEEIFVKTANEIMLSPRCNGTPTSVVVLPVAT